jgi:hypothetical protein
MGHEHPPRSQPNGNSAHSLRNGVPGVALADAGFGGERLHRLAFEFHAPHRDGARQARQRLQQRPRALLGVQRHHDVRWLAVVLRASPHRVAKLAPQRGPAQRRQAIAGAHTGHLGTQQQDPHRPMLAGRDARGDRKFKLRSKAPHRCR